MLVEAVNFGFVGLQFGRCVSVSNGARGARGAFLPCVPRPCEGCPRGRLQNNANLTKVTGDPRLYCMLMEMLG